MSSILLTPLEFRPISALVGDASLYISIHISTPTPVTLTLRNATSVPLTSTPTSCTLFISGEFCSIFQLPAIADMLPHAQVWIPVSPTYELRVGLGPGPHDDRDEPTWAVASVSEPPSLPSVLTPKLSFQLTVESIPLAQPLYCTLTHPSGTSARSASAQPYESPSSRFTATFLPGFELGLTLRDSVVDAVVLDSQADKAGLRPGDVCVERDPWTFERPVSLACALPPVLLDPLMWTGLVDVKICAGTDLESHSELHMPLAFQLGDGEALETSDRVLASFQTDLLAEPAVTCLHVAPFALTMSSAIVQAPVAAQDALQLACSLSLRGICLGFSSATDDVCFARVLRAKAYLGVFGDERRLIDVQLGHFQLDDCSERAVWPVVLAPVKRGSDDADAARLTVVYTAEGDATTHVHLIETYLCESACRLHESFVDSVRELLQEMPRPARGGGGSAGAERASKRHRWHIENADLRPMRFNLSLGLGPAAAGLSGVLGALAGALASVSDAPLRLDGLRLFNESGVGLGEALGRHYMAQATRGLLLLAGSTDLLLSPVSLVDSISKGAFSFFYEPALALSLGYGHVSRGLSRGSSQLVSSLVGAGAEAVNRFCRSLVLAMARLDPGAREQLARLGGFAEPVGVLEGLGAGMGALARGVLWAVLGGGGIPTRLARLVVQPAAGVLAAVAALATGLRNAWGEDAAEPAAAARLARHGMGRDELLLGYSGARASGLKLARALGGGGHFEYFAHVHVLLGGDRLAVLLVGRDWLVCCVDSDRPLWAVPCGAVRGADVVEGKTLQLEWAFAKVRLECPSRRLAEGMRELCLGKGEGWVDAVKRMRGTGGGSKRMRRFGSSVALEQVSVLDVLEDVVVSARIQSQGLWPDGIFRYRVSLASEAGLEWVIERRYSEFLAFRDRACRYLDVSRRFLPLPPKRPWALSYAELEARRAGLQRLLDMVLDVDLLREAEALKLFLSQDAREIRRWQEGE